MQVLIAVIEDLFQFVRSAFSGAVPYTPEVPTHLCLPAVKPSTPTSTMSLKLVSGEQYYIGVPDVSMHHDPVIAFDNVLCRLAYGQTVRLVVLQGRWAQVRLAGVLGWVFKDVLVAHSEDIYPHFVRGVTYTATHSETIKLRACIDDAFNGAGSGHVLTSAEYVHYRLQQKRLSIDWGDIRMRIPGTWQRKLRGRSGVHIGIHPRTNAVMEYIVDDRGHLAFVEAAFPDESITINEIGKYDDASYSQETMSSIQWRELHPVFIDVQ